MERDSHVCQRDITVHALDAKIEAMFFPGGQLARFIEYVFALWHCRSSHMTLVFAQVAKW